MAAYTVQTTALAGVAHTLAAVASSDTFSNDGRTLLVVANASGGNRIVTLTATATVDGLTITNPTVTIATGATKIIGPFPPRWFNSSSGVVTVTYDGTTSTTAAAVQMGNS